MEYLCVGFVGVVVVLLVFYVIAHLAEQRLQRALKAYQECLEWLKADPNNPDLRQRTLQLGREYSNLTRENNGVTIYDEIALKNDIDAACAGAVSVQARSVEERLAKLQQLHASGHITDDESRRGRQAILGEV